MFRPQFQRLASGAPYAFLKGVFLGISFFCFEGVGMSQIKYHDMREHEV